MATREQQILLQHYNGNGDGGGDNERSNNNQDHNQVLSAAINGHDDLLTIDTHTCITGVTACGLCRPNRDVDYLITFPIGYRFEPTDAELIQHYLIKKNNNLELPPNNIINENIYKFHPEDLIGDANTGEKTDWMMKEYRSLNKEEEDRKMGIKMIDIGLYKIYLKLESKTKTDNLRGTANQRGDGSDGLSADNGSRGDREVVAATSSPVQNNKRKRASRPKTTAANNAPLINEDKIRGMNNSQLGIRDGDVVRNSNGVYGNSSTTISTLDHDSTMFRDTPFPPPSNVNGSIYHLQQQMAAPQPHPNELYDSNHCNVDKCNRRRLDSTLRDHHRRHVEMTLTNNLCNDKEHHRIQTTWSKNNFSLHHRTNFHPVHYPPNYPAPTPYNDVGLSDFPLNNDQICISPAFPMNLEAFPHHRIHCYCIAAHHHSPLIAYPDHHPVTDQSQYPVDRCYLDADVCLDHVNCVEYAKKYDDDEQENRSS
ncbi:hypothetical protein Syun_030341 [Stephania yunnanensis]|uniref:NAC domain-containing protein n=1 Tax=Stephania yunnanensis TaxID=152371 RepID=A0AAP0EBT9_9MAGN